MDQPEFLKKKLSNFPADVIEHYNLNEKADSKGFIYIRCKHGMYGLPHAGIIAQKLLKERLEKHEYTQSDMMPIFWKHETRPISFTLLVDDFGVKYVGKEHADLFIDALKEHYTVAEDWEGTKYGGITLDWDYKKRQVHLSMPGYVNEALTQFQHEMRKLKDQPHKHAVPVFGATIQYAKLADTSPLLNEEDKKYVQQVTGTFLY